MKQNLLSRSFLLSDLAILSYLALFKFLAQLMTSRAYGYFRDELYYLAASRRLALGELRFRNDDQYKMVCSYSSPG